MLFLRLQHVQLLFLLLNIPNLVHLLFLKLVNNVLFQVLLGHYDIIEILVDIWRDLRAAIYASLLLLKEARSRILTYIELTPEHAIHFILLLSKLASNLPSSKPANPLARQFTLQISSREVGSTRSFKLIVTVEAKE